MKKRYKKGDKIYQVTFLSYDEIESQKANFLCFCNIEFNARLYNVETGITRSCGCIRKASTAARNFKHLSSIVIKAVEQDFKNNILSIRAISEKHELNPSKINSLKKKYYARI